MGRGGARKRVVGGRGRGEDVERVGREEKIRMGRGVVRRIEGAQLERVKESEARLGRMEKVGRAASEMGVKDRVNGSTARINTKGTSQTKTAPMTKVTTNTKTTTTTTTKMAAKTTTTTTKPEVKTAQIASSSSSSVETWLEGERKGLTSEGFLAMTAEGDSPLTARRGGNQVETHALWSGINKNRDVSTGPLARPFARTAHFAHFFARGKVNF